MQSIQTVSNAVRDTLNTYLPTYLTSTMNVYKDGVTLSMPKIYTAFEEDKITIENMPHIKIEAVGYNNREFLTPFAEHQRHTVNVYTTVSGENRAKLYSELMRLTESVYNTIRHNHTLGEVVQYADIQAVNANTPPFTVGSGRYNKKSTIRMLVLMYQQDV